MVTDFTASSCQDLLKSSITLQNNVITTFGLHLILAALIGFSAWQKQWNAPPSQKKLSCRSDANSPNFGLNNHVWMSPDCCSRGKLPFCAPQVIPLPHFPFWACQNTAYQNCEAAATYLCQILTQDNTAVQSNMTAKGVYKFNLWDSRNITSAIRTNSHVYTMCTIC